MSLRAASARLLHVGARARELGGAGDASVLRPKVVSDFQSQRVSQERFKWRLFGIGTWVLTFSAGAFVALSHFEGLPGSGDHALSGLQRRVASLGDTLFPPPPAAV